MKLKQMEWESDQMLITICKFSILKKEFHYKDNSKFKYSKNHNIFLHLIINLSQLIRNLKSNKLNRLNYKIL